jgi:hypothetical protein
MLMSLIFLKWVWDYVGERMLDSSNSFEGFDRSGGRIGLS